jgi:hypothetical protein
MATTLGKETFNLNKGEYSDKLGRIINNHRVNSKLIGDPADFILRSCRLTETWMKLAGDPDVKVYLRNIDIAGGRKVKMLSLERNDTKQPISKSKLIDALYPVKKIATTATPEEKHYNAVKGAMRNAVHYQLKAFRDVIQLPCTCYLSGTHIRRGMKTDVDHLGTSFSELADKFIALKGLTYTDISLQGPPTRKTFRDQQLWSEWTQYHLQHARFALVCASANRSKGSEGYTTPECLYGSFKAEDPNDLSLDF